MRIGISTAITQPGGPSGPPALHILDHFTGTNGTALSAHAPDINTPGNPWVATYGTWIINTNSAKCSVMGGSWSIAAIDAGVANVSVSVTHDSGNAGPAVRILDDGNFWVAYHSGTGLTLYEITGASAISRASVAGVDPPPVKVDVSVAGNVFIASVGSKNCTYTSATGNTRTKHGLFSEAVSILLDDFEVTP